MVAYLNFNNTRRVCVTGLGFVTSIGNDSTTVLSHIKELKHGLSFYPPFLKSSYPIKIAAPVHGFVTDSPDPEDWIAPPKLSITQSQLRTLSPHGLYAFYALYQALEDAQLTPDEISHPKTGLYTASSGSTALLYHHVDCLHKRGITRTSPTGILSSVVGTLNFNLNSAFKIKGSSSGFASACSSSGHALGHAFDEIKQGRQDRMIVVGGEDCSYENFLSFAMMRALSTSDTPHKASRPFDKNRNGFVPTGGATVMILEEESIAKQRNAPIYAEFLGWGQASDGYHPAKPEPNGEGLFAAINNALSYCQLTPKSIDYINAHATSTKTGDTSEIKALNRVFPKELCKPAISSTKALTGHGLSLASIMEAAFCVLCMKENIIPGSAHIEELDEEAKDLNIIQNTLQIIQHCNT